jgi:hypothetical protein
MNTPAKTVLSLRSSEAIDFFMKSEQYHGFELPVITFRERRAYDEIGY